MTSEYASSEVVLFLAGRSRNLGTLNLKFFKITLVDFIKYVQKCSHWYDFRIILVLAAQEVSTRVLLFSQYGTDNDKWY